MDGTIAMNVFRSDTVNHPSLSKELTSLDMEGLSPLFKRINILVPPVSTIFSRQDSEGVALHLERIYPALFYLVGLSDLDVLSSIEGYPGYSAMQKDVPEILDKAGESCTTLINNFPKIRSDHSLLNTVCSAIASHGRHARPKEVIRTLAANKHLLSLYDRSVFSIPSRLLQRAIHRAWKKFSLEMRLPDHNGRALIVYHHSVTIILLHLADRARRATPTLPHSLSLLYSATVDGFRASRNAGPRRNPRPFWPLIPGLLDAYASQISLEYTPSNAPMQHIMPLTISGNFHRGLGHWLPPTLLYPLTSAVMKVRLDGICKAHEKVLDYFTSPAKKNTMKKLYFDHCYGPRLKGWEQTSRLGSWIRKADLIPHDAQNIGIDLLYGWVLKFRLTHLIYRLAFLLDDVGLWQSKLNPREWIRLARTMLSTFGSAAYVASTALTTDPQRLPPLASPYLGTLATFLDHHAEFHSIEPYFHEDARDPRKDKDVNARVLYMLKLGSKSDISKMSSADRIRLAKANMSHTLSEAQDWIKQAKLSSKSADTYRILKTSIKVIIWEWCNDGRGSIGSLGWDVSVETMREWLVRRIDKSHS